MSDADIKQGYVIQTTDGPKWFETKSEARDFKRTPLMLKALKALAKDGETAQWLLDNRDEIASAFEGGKIQRVTKADRKALEKALDEITSGFLFNNQQAILDSFRWPAVKRFDEADAEAYKAMTPEGKKEYAANKQASEVYSALTDITGDDADGTKMATWLQDNKDSLMLAYEAGVEKREVSPKATEALAAYRAMTPEQRAAAQAAKAAEKAAAAKAKETAAKAAAK
jgi:hypothetical protein